ncbi:MAG: polyprenyl synthetase family protein [Firmicutes bacterium]|nr:polyprenyl synthetase family protein [Bacillota bacterium]
MNPQAIRAQARPLELFAAIEPELRQVEAALEEALATRDRLVGEVSTHLLRAGGKRIRPALVLLSAKFPGSNPEKVIPVAVAVELIHMATLVHDDVVDNAHLRRGQPTVNAVWNNQVSVLTGDYLFAKSFALLAETGDPRVVRLMANVVYEMSKGELVQMASYFDVDQTEEDYLRRIAQKTGYLIAESCRLGALVAGAKPDQVEALYQYGLGIGLSFQIADDLLDFMGQAETMGKPVCGDLKEGILTLPVLHALRHPRYGEELRRLIQSRSIGDPEVQRVREILEAAGSFAYARRLARQYLDAALAHLDRVPELASREVLRTLADFVINRQF